jgi:methyl-accepting chemotaxis protein
MAMKLVTKMIVVEGLVLVAAALVVGGISSVMSTAALASQAKDRLQNDAHLIATALDDGVKGHMKFAEYKASSPFIVNAAAAVEQARGPLQDLLKAATDRLVQATQGGADYELAACVGTDSVVFAASDAGHVGASYADQAWVTAALKGTTSVGAETASAATGRPVMPVAAPILSGTTVTGAYILLVTDTFLRAAVATEKIGAQGYAYVVDGGGVVIAHPVESNVFTTRTLELAGMRDFAGHMVAGEHGVSGYVFQGVAKTAGYAPVPSTKWSVGVTMPDTEYLAPASRVTRIIILVCAIGLLMGVLVNILLARSVTNQLGTEPATIRDIALRVADGDLTVSFPPGTGRSGAGAYAALKTMVENLTNMVATIQEIAELLVTCSREIVASTGKLSEGTQSLAASTEETAASVEQLSASVELVADNARAQAAAVDKGGELVAQVQKAGSVVTENLEGIAGLVGESVVNAQQGSRAVQDVVTGISGIAEGSEKIGGIVTVIRDIADQTNLLALNASIEAARAGENGRGFSVVAQEVGKLAERSGSSTKEIVSLIAESAKEIARGVGTARNSQTAMESIRTASERVREKIAILAAEVANQASAADAMFSAFARVTEMSQGIASAAQEQALGARTLASGVENVNQVTQNAAAAVGEISSATEQISQMSEELQELTDRFTTRFSGAALVRAKKEEA